ncbi:DNA primase small subunit, putative [Perkinsus marinus ATCC 50983]|uniref:DNA primase n=1 Tax=Perkinsus marinus (strain ATCC 50983 / TXsc) TaxID=423536 RepID=C5KY18_PERM5|nr:DNA primase small subunit, putative [Perkinsus marinus ATCC 50983]EER10625.1 DNA primase small subunit, putative [Perkinsus marinus ATCC 50983]|eukprot:XP_002778830.1 DNA primase small subunit, putative [Perkinsus marinus ATCC 50983]
MSKALTENDAGMANSVQSAEVTPEALRIYYERLFPSRDFCRWLSYREDGPGGKVAADKGGFLFRREFSFTLPGDIYCRYLSFHGQHDFRKALLDRVPDKIDIGAVFNIPPTHYQQFGLTGGSGGGFQPQQRELVFDIDMDDYDDVRNCCKGSSICKLCWTFIACAVKILNRALRDDFGFKHILFVFSGRRGVHCWVCDETARKLSNEQRSAVAEYLQLLNGGRCKHIRSSAQQRHPHVRRGIDICRKYLLMPECGLLEGQRLLDAPMVEGGDKNLLQKVVNTVIPATDPVGRGEAKSFLSSKRSSREVWQWLTARCSNSVLLDEIVLEMAYPRLDINVSKQMNHLLKAPFCIHPKTGRVCVPIIDVEKPESFNPASVPTVAQLISELASRKEDDGEKQTSLAKYLTYFRKSVDEIERDILGEKRDVEMEF